MSDTGQVSGKTAVDLAFGAYEQGVRQGRAEAAPPARREAVWTTEVGEVRLSYPDPMPMWEVEFLEEFVALWLRGLRRRAATIAAEALSSETPPSQSAEGVPAILTTDEPNPSNRPEGGGA